ncbi:MAG TPA: hypothetical protein PLV50_03135 [Smithella sp.]|nr:hypothetical protein [Smithella sp.]
MKYLYLIILCMIIVACHSGDQFGTTTEEVGIYELNGSVINERDKPIPLRFKKGIKVKLIEKEVCQSPNGSEKMIFVMMENPSGDFVDGNLVCVPARKIKRD